MNNFKFDSVLSDDSLFPYINSLNKFNISDITTHNTHGVEALNMYVKGLYDKELNETIGLTLYSPILENSIVIKSEIIEYMTKGTMIKYSILYVNSDGSIVSEFLKNESSREVGIRPAVMKAFNKCKTIYTYDVGSDNVFVDETTEKLYKFLDAYYTQK